MRVYYAPLVLMLAQPCLAADVIGGAQRVLGVQLLDETKAKITVQGQSAADTYVVDCIGATWGFEGGTQKPVSEDQRSQAVAERACRDLQFKSALLTEAGDWRAPDAPIAAKSSRPTASPQKPIAPADYSIYNSYTPDQYPKTFAVWGAEGVEYLRVMERLAVVQVEAARACDKVELIGLSEGRSQPPKNAVMFVDCENGNRFYVGAPELQKSPDDLAYKKVY